MYFSNKFGDIIKCQCLCTLSNIIHDNCAVNFVFQCSFTLHDSAKDLKYSLIMYFMLDLHHSRDPQPYYPMNAMMALFSFKESRVNRLIRKSYAEQQTEPLVPLHQVITAMCSPTLATLYWERLALVACQYAFLSIQRDRHPRVITTVISWLPLGSNCSIGPADYTPSTHNL